MAKKIKVYGLPRSATNMLEWLLRKNVALADVLNNNNSGSKHALACFQYTKERAQIFALAVKNPYSWLDSMYRWVQRQPKGRYVFSTPFGAFMRRKFAYPEAVGKVFWPHPLEAWNRMYEHWLSLKNTFVFQHEHLLTRKGTEKRLAAFVTRYGLALKGKVAYPVVGINPSLHLANGPINHKHYKKKLYMRRFGPLDRAFIEDRVDRAVALRLGYKL